MTVDNVSYGSGPAESEYPEENYLETQYDYPSPAETNAIAPTDQVNLIECRYNQQG